jgi:hypothetical protein
MTLPEKIEAVLAFIGVLALVVGPVGPALGSG